MALVTLLLLVILVLIAVPAIVRAIDNPRDPGTVAVGIIVAVLLFLAFSGRI